MEWAAALTAEQVARSAASRGRALPLALTRPLFASLFGVSLFQIGQLILGRGTRAAGLVETGAAALVAPVVALLARFAPWQSGS